MEQWQLQKNTNVPFMISDKIAAALSGCGLFESVESVKPGFLNIKISSEYLADLMNGMIADEGRYGCEKAENPLTIIVDYGGPMWQNLFM